MKPDLGGLVQRYQLLEYDPIKECLQAIACCSKNNVLSTIR